MLKESFMTGPFEIQPVAGGYRICYGEKIKSGVLRSEGATRQAVLSDIDDELRSMRWKLRNRTEICTVELLDYRTQTVLHSFDIEGRACGEMQGAIPDDSSYLWAVVQTSKRAQRIASLQAWFSLMQQHRAPANVWIANLLPEAVLSTDLEQWRAPTSWELRHVVGEGSLTGISGAKAAEMVGITPANFRKYTASDSAKNRQPISYAAWHLLLQRLHILRPL